VPLLSTLAAKDVVYEGLDKALAVPGSEIRLFAKPEALVNRRMGVALASADTVEAARKKAALSAKSVGIRPA
jgi:phosphoribosylglycinamide formyltransferase 2